MARVAFLYPGSHPWDALDFWVWSLWRHCKQHEVVLCRTPADALRIEADTILALTETTAYPRLMIEADLEFLRDHKKVFGVVHNHSRGDGVPSGGFYPSFCWSKGAHRALHLRQPGVTLLRQPVFPPLIPGWQGDAPMLVGTFGQVEPKKQTRQMFQWAKMRDIPFAAWGPDTLANQYEWYIQDLRNSGCAVTIHLWQETVEGLAPLLSGVSHFLFVLTEAKTGTGGSPTSPRYAGFFNRPVIVIDDEDTFEADGYYVYKSLEEINKQDLAWMKPPKTYWSPDAYVGALVQHTQKFWRER